MSVVICNGNRTKSSPPDRLVKPYLSVQPLDLARAVQPMAGTIPGGAIHPNHALQDRYSLVTMTAWQANQRSKGHKDREEPCCKSSRRWLNSGAIRVREEKLLGGAGYRVRGGGCRVHGKDTVFLDREYASLWRKG